MDFTLLGWVLHGEGMNLTWLGSESYMVRE
jgi:hypothetical protein